MIRTRTNDGTGASRRRATALRIGYRPIRLTSEVMMACSNCGYDGHESNGDWKFCTDALRARIAELELMISDEPRNKTLLPPHAQRLWEVCVLLSEKAEFKFMFRYELGLEEEITRLRGLFKRLNDGFGLHPKAQELVDEALTVKV